jgi:outer membrane protein
MDRKKMAVIIGIVMLAGGFLAGVSRAAELKIGAVDIGRAVNECQAGKEAKKAITKEVEKFQTLVQEKQKDLQALKESLEKQAPMLTLDARTNKEKEYQGKLRDFQRWVEDSQNEVNQKTREMERTISIGLVRTIQRLGAEEGFTLILEKNEQIVLYASKAIDVTDRVIKSFDAQKR